MVKKVKDAIRASIVHEQNGRLVLAASQHEVAGDLLRENKPEEAIKQYASGIDNLLVDFRNTLRVHPHHASHSIYLDKVSHLSRKIGIIVKEEHSKNPTKAFPKPAK